MRPTQPPIKRVLGGSSLGVKRGWGMMLTIHPHLVLRSRMSKSYISSPSWHLRGIAGQLYFTLLCRIFGNKNFIEKFYKFGEQ
jgi:hypothetical protein